jgi:hypothetical protein
MALFRRKLIATPVIRLLMARSRAALFFLEEPLEPAFARPLCVFSARLRGLKSNFKPQCMEDAVMAIARYEPWTVVSQLQNEI